MTLQVTPAELEQTQAPEMERPLFFPKHGTPLAPHNAGRTFRGILKDAGLEGKNTSPHAFRRADVTPLANELDMQAAADTLGHAA